MRVCIFGVGYVGLIQAAALARAGHDVIAVDTDRQKIERLSDGIVPIFEPDLTENILTGVAAGKLIFSVDGAEAVKQTDVIFIAVGTPSSSDGSADLQHVFAVARLIGQNMDGNKVVAIKSTVPIGTSDAVRTIVSTEIARRGQVGITTHIASNPEFLREGSAMADFLRPDRVVIGTDSQHAETVLRELYSSFVDSDERFHVMDARSAELTKYAANSMLAAKISFMNEIAAIADALGADIEKVRTGIAADPRIGPHFLHAGAGYGGACFPKDVRALIHVAEQVGIDASVLKSIEYRNEAQKQVLFERVKDYFGGDLAGRTIALWGLSFKPNTNDMREAPSRVLLEALWKAKANVRVYDPEAMEECRSIYGIRPDLTYCSSEYSAVRGADALVVVTEWQVFKSPDFKFLRKSLASRVIFDGRNLYDPLHVASHGLEYFCIGRPRSIPELVPTSSTKKKRRVAGTRPKRIPAVSGEVQVA